MTGQLRDYPVNPSAFIYHRDIGFPESLKVNQGFYKLRYTNHARERQAKKYDGLKVLPSVVNITDKNVVEVHSNDKTTANKLLVRIHYDRTRDIVLALQPFDGYCKVITFWLNNKKDQHLNLDKTKYTHP
jgi:hypothetical protein